MMCQLVEMNPDVQFLQVNLKWILQFNMRYLLTSKIRIKECKKVHRGDKARFWLDKWCGNTLFSELFPDLFEAAADKDATVQHYGEWREGVWSWNILRGTDMDNVDAENLMYMQNVLQDIRLHSTDDDKWIWAADNKRIFSVKSVYVWLTDCVSGGQQILNEEQMVACLKIWHNSVPTKAAMLAWRLLINRLPTRDALIRRGMLDPVHEACCVFCSQEEENVNHLFFGCRKLLEVWKAVGDWLDVTIFIAQQPEEHFKLFGDQLKGRKLKGLKHIIWIASVWVIWLTRNKVIFEGSVANVPPIVNHIITLSWGWFIYRKGRNTKLNYVDWLNCPMGCMLSV